MFSRIRLGTGLAFLLAPAPGPVLAQAVSQADVQIQALTVTRRQPTPIAAPGPRGLTVGRTAPGAQLARQDALDVVVTVFSHNDDDAHAVQVRLFLPPESMPLAMPAGCAPSVPPGPTPTPVAFVTCDLGDFAVGASRTVQLAITVPPPYVVPRVSAFAWSVTSDPGMANNFAERVAP